VCLRLLAHGPNLDVPRAQLSTTVYNLFAVPQRCVTLPPQLACGRATDPLPDPLVHRVGRIDGRVPALQSTVRVALAVSDSAPLPGPRGTCTRRRKEKRTCGWVLAIGGRSRLMPRWSAVLSTTSRSTIVLEPTSPQTFGVFVGRRSGSTDHGDPQPAGHWPAVSAVFVGPCPDVASGCCAPATRALIGAAGHPSWRAATSLPHGWSWPQAEF